MRRLLPCTAPIALRSSRKVRIFGSQPTGEWQSSKKNQGSVGKLLFYMARMKGGAYTILKSVVVRDDITYVVHANGRLLRQSSFDLEIRSLQDLEALLQIVAKKFILGCSCSDGATR